MGVRFYTATGRCVRFASFDADKAEEIKEFLLNDIPNYRSDDHIAYYDDFVLAEEADEMPPAVVAFLSRLIDENGGSVDITFTT